MDVSGKMNTWGGKVKGWTDTEVDSRKDALRKIRIPEELVICS
jgi:hypothetical protein